MVVTYCYLRKDIDEVLILHLHNSLSLNAPPFKKRCTLKLRI